MKIQNISMADIKSGDHIPSTRAVLIQICDPGYEFPVPKHQFVETHQFEFLDCELDNDYPDEAKFSQEQAAQIIAVLTSALEQQLDVVVHCHAGLCRSGAIAEVGVMMGFEETNRRRQPNLLVKYRLLAELDWTYDDGPGEEDGPWAPGWEERCGGQT